MGAAGSAGLSREAMQKMTAAEVVALVEQRARPRIIAQAVRDNELDGSTLLEMDEADVRALASGLDQKKLLGGFRELQAELKTTTTDESCRDDEPVIFSPASSQRRANVACSRATTTTKDTPAIATAAVTATSANTVEAAPEPRKVFRDAKYDEAWARLSVAERCTLGELVRDVELKVRVVEDLLASYVLDPKNQRSDANYGQRLLLYGQHRKDEREVVLSKLRELQQHEAKNLNDFIESIMAATYATVPGIPTKSFSQDAHPDQVHQPIECCFDDFEVAHVVTHDQWTPRVGATLRRAAEIVTNPEFTSTALERHWVNPNDPMWLAIKLDHRDKRTLSLNWLFAEHLLVSESFHHEVDRALATLVTSNACKVAHSIMKSGARAKDKTAVAGEYGSLTPKPCTRFLKDIIRCSVVCESHAALEEAYDLILRSFAAAGPPKDHRGQMPYDVLLNVFFRDLVVISRVILLQCLRFIARECMFSLVRVSQAEIQFQLSPILKLKVLSDLSYTLCRVKTENFQALSIFDFPSIHLENAARSDIRCKLKF